MDKLSKEDIKYCVDEFKPEGFRFLRDLYLYLGCCNISSSDTPISKALNSLFFQRVIEAINKKYRDTEEGYRIEQFYDMTLVLSPTDNPDFSDYKEFGYSDEDKEAVIKWIVDQVRGE